MRTWVTGTAKPHLAGILYERQTFLGVIRDWWDGNRWRRAIKHPRAESYSPGVVCANQALPWRPLADLMEMGGDENPYG